MSVLSDSRFQWPTNPAHGFVDHAEKFDDVERFGEIITRSCGHKPLDLVRRSIRADDYDRNVARKVVLAEPREDFVAAKIGQMEVEQNEIGQMLARQIESEASLHGGEQLNVRLLGEHLFDESEIRQVVFDIENLSTFGSRYIIRRHIARLGQRLQGRFRRGQIDPKSAPLADDTSNADVTTHRMHQSLAKRQAESGTFHSGLLDIEPVERREEPRQLLSRDPAA